MKTQWERRWPPASQGVRPQKKPNLLKPWSWTSSLQNCDKINICHLRHSVSHSPHVAMAAEANEDTSLEERWETECSRLSILSLFSEHPVARYSPLSFYEFNLYFLQGSFVLLLLSHVFYYLLVEVQIEFKWSGVRQAGKFSK